MVNKRGKIKIGLTVFIILIFIILLLQIQTTFSSEENLKINKSEMDVKYNVNPPQLATVGRGGGAKSSLLQKPKSLLEEISEIQENKSEEIVSIFNLNDSVGVKYDPEILEEFNKTNQTEIKVLVYYKDFWDLRVGRDKIIYN